MVSSLRQVERAARVHVGVVGRPLVGDDPATQVADGAAYVAVSEIQPDGVRRARRERHLQRRASDRGRAFLVHVVALLLDHAGELELVQQRRDGRAGEPERAPEIGPATSGVTQQRLQHANAVRMPNARSR